jgi:Uma2 family endonuclease
VVEVSETSLTLDRAHKGSLYARAGLVDYWIVNLPERRLEVHRDAEPDATARFGWRYRSITILEPGASVSPLARPDRRIQVSDLFA